MKHVWVCKDDVGVVADVLSVSEGGITIESCDLPAHFSQSESLRMLESRLPEWYQVPDST